MKSPIIFSPIFKERVWGGRQLQLLYGKNLPQESVYGESWEISDREESQSVVTQGKYKGKTLQELWTTQHAEVFGTAESTSARFPLLLKILDAQTNLSVQAHPSDEVALLKGKETKHECWYIVHAEPNAKIYKSLKEGKTKQDLLQSIEQQDIESCLDSHEVQAGDFVYIPSGEVHALGAGVVVFEIQQNSDTTYRLYDWGRVGINGKPRELHLEQAMQTFTENKPVYPLLKKPKNQSLLVTPYFTVEHRELQEGDELKGTLNFQIIIMIEGMLSDSEGLSYGAGQFLLLPSKADALTAELNTSILKVTLPY